MELGTVALNAETTGGIADDPAFRDAAAQAAGVGEETDLIQLADGGIATLRVDSIDPPAVDPPRPRSATASPPTGRAARTAEALQKLADGYVAELKGGLGFPDLAQRLDRPIRSAGPLTRGETAQGAPPELVADVFAAADGARRSTRRDGDGVILAAAHRHRAPSTPTPRPTRRSSTSSAASSATRRKRRPPRALHRGAARRGRRDAEPAADRLDPRALPLTRDAALPRDRGLHRRLRGGPQPGGLDPPRRRPRHAGQPDAEADRGAQGQLPARERHRRRGARPLLDHGHEARPRSGSAAAPPPGSTARPASTPTAGAPSPTARSPACARSSARAASSCPPELPPMAAGLFGYLGYDMVRLVEHLPHVNPDPLGLPDAIMLRPSVVLIVDGVKGEVTVVSPAWANSGLNPRAAYAQAAERVMDAVRDLDRTPPQASRDLGDLVARRAGLQHQPRALPRDGRAGEGVHPRRRHLPGRPLPALGAAVRPAALRPLPRAAAHQPVALHVLLQLRRLPGDRRQPRDPRPRRGRHRHDPPARRHPPARRDRRPRTSRSRPELLADPKERAEHIMLVDLGRNDVGRVAKIGSVDPNDVHHRALQPRHAHRLQRRRRARATARTPSPPSSPASPPAPSRARRRSAPCRSSTSSSPRSAASTAAPSATSTSPATWTPASRSAPPW